MKNILITGAAGMVGSSLISKLIKKKNHFIIGIDNFTLGKKKYIKPLFKYKNFKFLNFDVSKEIKNKQLLKILSSK